MPLSQETHSKEETALLLLSASDKGQKVRQVYTKTLIRNVVGRKTGVGPTNHDPNYIYLYSSLVLSVTNSTLGKYWKSSFEKSLFFFLR